MCARGGIAPPADCVLFLHTGGLPAILAYPDRLGPDVAAAVLEPEVQLVKRSCGGASQGRAARRGSDNPRSVGRCRVRTWRGRTARPPCDGGHGPEAAARNRCGSRVAWASGQGLAEAVVGRLVEPGVERGRPSACPTAKTRGSRGRHGQPCRARRPASRRGSRAGRHRRPRRWR